MKSSPKSRAWCGRSWWRTRSPSSSDSSSSGWTPMPEAPQAGQATFNFKAAITQMVQRNASDLLLKVGRPATIRVNGELVPLDSSSPLKPEELKSLAEQIMTPRQVKEFAEHKETLDTALKAADTGHLVFSTLHTTDATQTINRVISFFPPHQHDEVRHLLSTALQAIVSLRLVPRKDGKGRVPASEVLINTAAVQENMRDLTKSLSIPDLIAQGSVQYGMQSFDQSLFHWYQQGMVSYESAIFYATNPSEFALKVSGVDSGESQSFGGTTAAAGLRGDITP